MAGFVDPAIGEFYCALATAIGKSGKSLAQLVTQLGRHFPSEKVEEALKHLIERRYIVEASPTSGSVVAGYWASLGLTSGVAEQNLANCRVLVEAFDVQGAKEFTKALAGLIISHDLLGSTTVKHDVPKRPQCPTCGSKKLRDPRRQPAPIELGLGLKLMMTSG